MNLTRFKEDRKEEYGKIGGGIGYEITIRYE